MQIEIDVQLLIDYGISADDYLALYAIYRKGFKTLNSLSISPRWEDLQTKGFVKLGNTPEEHVVRQKFIDLFSTDFDQMFNELLGLYPMKVRTKNGTNRILRANDPNSKANKKAKERYRRIVGNKKHIHKKILRLLDVQLKEERFNLEYMQSLEVWLNNHTWEKYQDIENATEETTNRVTRRL